MDVLSHIDNYEGALPWSILYVRSRTSLKSIRF